MSVTIDDKKLKDALSKMMHNLAHPKPIYSQIGLILRDGFIAQFETAGAHWGDKWQQSGEQIKALRDWQGYNYDRNHPGIGTGETKKSFTYVADDQSVVIGTVQKSAASFQEGSNTPVLARFPKKGGSGQWKWGYFPKVPPRQVTPKRGLTKQEENAMLTAVIKGLTRGLG